MKIEHPERGELPIEMRGSCPHVPRKLALELIAELEDRKFGIPKKVEEFAEEISWMHDLVQKHPVLNKLPEHVRRALVVPPGEWSDLPSNQRLRKLWKREG